MNQDLFLNTDNINPTRNSGGKKHAVNGQSDTKDKDLQDFSSELDKHIDKQASADKTATPDVKKSHSQDKTIDSKNQQQAEEVESKNGNSLPNEKLSAEKEANINEEQNIENLVIVGDEVELSNEIIINGQAVDQHPDVESQLKESFTKKADAVVADSNKELEKIASADVETKQVLVIKQDSETLNQNKQQQETPKIRPDILQALSARVDSKDGENNPVKNDLKTLLTAEQLVDKKPPFKELQLSDLMKTLVPEKTQQTSQLADRSTNNIANALVNMPSASVTESVVKSVVPSLDIQPTVQSNGWNKVLTGRVIWMAREGIQQATLQLNPASLGSIDVKLMMQDERVHVTFVAQHAATRDVLEQALPRLRDSFIENGLEFADAEVLQQDFQQADSSHSNNDNINAEAGQSVISDEGVDSEQVVTTEQNIEIGISLYA